MKIISWNVNGIRANVKKGAFQWLIDQNADLFCLQETKAHPEQLDQATVAPEGYTSYFDHSRTRKGYSGVAIYVKNCFTNNISVTYGMGIPELDQEGRLISMFFNQNNDEDNQKYAVITVYFPNGGGGPERLDYKLRFYDAFLGYIQKLRKDGYNIIFCGDVNTAHTEIDLARPKENVENTGFLPIERAWIDKVIQAGYIDVFRSLYPTQIDTYTYWDMKTFARERNVGWRIDYFFVNNELMPHVTHFTTHADVYGSDHCPIEIEVEI